MSEPRRILDEGGAEDLRLALLRSAREDAPPPQAKGRLLQSLGLDERAAGKLTKQAASRGGQAKSAEGLVKASMFDSVLHRGNVAKGRFGPGAIFSVAIHAALLGLALYISSRPPEEKKKSTDVTFVAAAPPPPPPEGAPPPPPPPPPPKRSNRPKVEKTVEVKDPEPIKKPDTIVEAKEEAAEKPVEVAESNAGGSGDDDDGVEGGVVGGVKGGVVGGTLGGVLGNPLPPQPQNVVIPFGAGMNRPSMVSGSDPVYTKEALAARVEGLMIVRCVITVTGSITNCRIIKGLPHMDQAVVSALQGRKYSPVTFNGRPVAVDYVFNIRLVLPTR